MNLTKDTLWEEIPSFDEIIHYLQKKNRPISLLFGNGFSMAYDSKIFSYNALYDFVINQKDPELSKLFDAINSKNFEEIMRQIDQYIDFSKKYGVPKEIIEMLEKSHLKLQSSLIDAISELHPDHVFEIEDSRSKQCFSFLSIFLESGGKLFSTNYDLLSYWVLMRNNSKISIDGFGKEVLNPEEIIKGDEPELSDLEWGINKKFQNIFYLHGSLPIFDLGHTIIKEVYDTKAYLLQNIKNRMEKGEYPVFVTSGDGLDKLNQIYHNKYLTYCYDQLCELTGSLITLGFNFGKYDFHIIDAINKAAIHGKKKVSDKLWSIYIGVYTEEDLEHIKSILHLFQVKVNIYKTNDLQIW